MSVKLFDTRKDRDLVNNKITADVSLIALEASLMVTISGVSEREVREFLACWERCGAVVMASGPWDDARNYVASVRGSSAPVDESDAEFEGTTFGEFLELLSGFITHQAISQRRRDLLLLHAAGVADPVTGSTVVLIGPSGRGKTTAASTLGTHFGYVSDETVGIDDDLRVAAYPKPLSVLHADSAWKLQTSPNALGLKALPDRPLYVSALVLLDRGKPGTEPRLSSVTFREAVQDLVPQISYLSARDRPLQRLASIASRAGFYRLRYSDPAHLESVVRPLFSRPVGCAPDPDVGLVKQSQSSSALENGSIVRCPVGDIIDDGDVSIVLIDQHVVVLQGIGPAIWRACAEAQTVASLTDMVIDEFGEPLSGDPAAAVRDAVAELTEQGLLGRC